MTREEKATLDAQLDGMTDSDLLFRADHAVYHLEKTGNEYAAHVIQELQNRYEWQRKRVQYMQDILKQNNISYIEDSRPLRKANKLIRK